MVGLPLELQDPKNNVTKNKNINRTPPLSPLGFHSTENLTFFSITT